MIGQTLGHYKILDIYELGDHEGRSALPDAFNPRVTHSLSSSYTAILFSDRTVEVMEPAPGFEPRTCCLQDSCSTPELCRR